MVPLSKLNILIADDDKILAQDLSRTLTGAGASVIGPVQTISAALPITPRANVAVLELLLDGRHTFKLADKLQDMNIPIIFYSAYANIDVPQRHFTVPRLGKPAAIWHHRATSGHAASDTHLAQDVKVVLPKLRLVARLLYEDPYAADRLTERTLTKALTEPSDRNRNEPLDDWLIRICLREAFEVEHFLN